MGLKLFLMNKACAFSYFLYGSWKAERAMMGTVNSLYGHARQKCVQLARTLILEFVMILSYQQDVCGNEH